jgi:TatD DNase family protein
MLLNFMAPTLFDSHCHFDFPEFDADRESVWRACQDLGVSGMMIPGVSPDQWQRAGQLCQANQGLVYSVGIHPHWLAAAGLSVGDNNCRLDEIRQSVVAHVQSPYCCALGETGLDELIETPRALLELLLIWHLLLAAEFNKPVILHSVRAHHYLLPILKEYRPARGGVIHAFGGSYETARQYWDLGFYLGVGGTITYERAAKTRAAVQKMPLESLLLETDAPDMPLQGFQGQRNSPGKVIEVGNCLANLRAQPLALIAQQTSDNAQRLFGVGVSGVKNPG